MKLKTLTAVAVSSLLAASVVCASPANSTNSTGSETNAATNPMTLADDSSMQQNTMPNSSNPDANVGADTPPTTNPADSNNTTTPPSDNNDDSSADTATGDDDY